jgi:hypothetical protein
LRALRRLASIWRNEVMIPREELGSFPNLLFGRSSSALPPRVAELSRN